MQKTICSSAEHEKELAILRGLCPLTEAAAAAKNRQYMIKHTIIQAGILARRLAWTRPLLNVRRPVIGYEDYSVFKGLAEGPRRAL